MNKKNILNSWTFLVMFTIVSSVFMILLILFLLNIIQLGYLTGYLIGVLFLLSMIPLLIFSIKELIRTENIYYYLMLFFVRMPLILIPFLFAIFMPNYFSFFGVLIACAPFVIYFFIKNYTDGKSIIKRKGEV